MDHLLFEAYKQLFVLSKDKQNPTKIQEMKAEWDTQVRPPSLSSLLSSLPPLSPPSPALLLISLLPLYPLSFYFNVVLFQVVLELEHAVEKTPYICGKRFSGRSLPLSPYPLSPIPSPYPLPLPLPLSSLPLSLPLNFYLANLDSQERTSWSGGP